MVTHDLVLALLMRVSEYLGETVNVLRDPDRFNKKVAGSVSPSAG